MTALGFLPPPRLPEAPNLLGISGESIHAPAGEEGRYRRLAGIRRRFDLLTVAQRLAFDPNLPADKQHATVWCHRTAHSTAATVPVHRAVDGSSARLVGVLTCGMVWTCPVCCARVADQRRTELSLALARHVQAGGGAYLVTFTFPHDVHDRLADLLERLAKARQAFQNSRTWKAWKAEAAGGDLDVAQGVTSLEVTLGHNGWHPHLHMLVFARRGAFGEGEPVNGAGDLWSPVIGELASRWVDQLVKVGLCDRAQITEAMRHAFNVRGGEKAAEYIAKWGRDETWGLSAELTTQHAKVGGRRVAPKTWHHTPFQLLQLIEQGESQFIPAWHEYVEAFAGKRMLTWSPGLKDHFGVRDLTDEDLAAQGRAPAPDENHVATLSYPQFVQVTACRAVGRLVEFVAKHGGQEDAQRQVDAWIAWECRLPSAPGAVRRRMEGMSRFTVLPPNAPR